LPWQPSDDRSCWTLLGLIATLLVAFVENCEKPRRATCSCITCDGSACMVQAPGGAEWGRFPLSISLNERVRHEGQKTY
jgi:hypothetical protein